MVNIQIDGQIGHAEKLDQKQEKNELLETATQMDMPRIDPIEIPTPSPDIKGNAEASKIYLTEAEIVRKQTILEKRRANAANARARRAEMRKARTISLPPDPMEMITKQINESIDRVFQDKLKSMVSYTPAERNASTSESEIVKTEIAATGDNKVVQQVDSKIEPRKISEKPKRYYSTNAYIDHQKKKVQRLQSFFENISFTQKPIQSTSNKTEPVLYF